MKKNDEHMKNKQQFEDKKTEKVKNQQNESYQDSVMADKLNNNKDIYTFNNRNK